MARAGAKHRQRPAVTVYYHPPPTSPTIIISSSRLPPQVIRITGITYNRRLCLCSARLSLVWFSLGWNLHPPSAPATISFPTHGRSSRSRRLSPG